jgi:ribosome biogenesis protein NSA2
MKKTLKMHEEKDAEVKVTKENEAALPTYLLDRDETNRSKILSNTIKQKRKEKAGKWQVPIPKVSFCLFIFIFKIFCINFKIK